MTERLTLDQATLAGLRPPERLSAPARPSERHPWLLPWAVRAHRMRRHWRWLTSDTVWATSRSAADLRVLVKEHDSPLLRQLTPHEMPLQHGKVVNLRLASARIDGLLIGPGETFSFNRVVGNCTRRKGYVEGMRLARGDPAAGVGGGICQLANLVHWLVLHSELTVVERSEHSVDPFPDQARVLPWGVGCSIVYNYVDLVVRNDTDATFQLRVRVGRTRLHGRLLTDREPAREYAVAARDERFFGYRDRVFRANEIWRTAFDPRSGDRLGEELVRRNCAVVKYQPAGVTVLEVVDDR